MSNWERFIKVPAIMYVGGDRPWELMSDGLYLTSVPEIVDKMGGFVFVPRGYRTDLASVPRLPFAYWRAGGKGSLPAILHDYLYEHGDGISRKAADDVFAEAMKEVEDPSWFTTRWLMYSAVRLGGGRSWRRYRRERELATE